MCVCSMANFQEDKSRRRLDDCEEDKNNKEQQGRWDDAISASTVMWLSGDRQSHVTYFNKSLQYVVTLVFLNKREIVCVWGIK